jgi:hypothetical protein
LSEKPISPQSLQAPAVDVRQDRFVDLVGPVDRDDEGERIATGLRINGRPAQPECDNGRECVSPKNAKRLSEAITRTTIGGDWQRRPLFTRFGAALLAVTDVHELLEIIDR